MTEGRRVWDQLENWRTIEKKRGEDVEDKCEFHQNMFRFEVPIDLKIKVAIHMVSHDSLQGRIWAFKNQFQETQSSQLPQGPKVDHFCPNIMMMVDGPLSPEVLSTFLLDTRKR